MATETRRFKSIEPQLHATQGNVSTSSLPETRLRGTALARLPKSHLPWVLLKGQARVFDGASLKPCSIVALQFKVDPNTLQPVRTFPTRSCTCRKGAPKGGGRIKTQ